MPECSFCKRNYEIPRGLTYVLENGDILYFCSSKCRKNWKMGRRGDKQKWVKKQIKNKIKKDKSEE